MTAFLTAEQILYLHDRLIRETGGSHGLRDIPGLLSAVGCPQSYFEGRYLYPDIFSQAAALMESLIRNHPFVDGNIRTGIAAAALFLRINGFRLKCTQAELVTTALQVANGELDIDGITAWLRSRSAREQSSRVGARRIKY